MPLQRFAVYSAEGSHAGLELEHPAAKAITGPHRIAVRGIARAIYLESVPINQFQFAVNGHGLPLDIGVVRVENHPVGIRQLVIDVHHRARVVCGVSLQDDLLHDRLSAQG